MTTTHTRWFVLLAHGSRDADWRRPLERLGELLEQRAPEAGVCLAYLQLAEPTLETALRSCRDQGGRTALVVPVFLSGGGHLLRDVPRITKLAAAEVEKLSTSEPSPMAPRVTWRLLRGERVSNV